MTIRLQFVSDEDAAADRRRREEGDAKAAEFVRNADPQLASLLAKYTAAKAARDRYYEAAKKRLETLAAPINWARVRIVNRLEREVPGFEAISGGYGQIDRFIEKAGKR